MNAYDETYLYDAMKNLGEAFDYAVNACGLDADNFASLFIASGIADKFMVGNPKYVVGKTGTELVMDVFEKTGEKKDFPDAQTEYSASAEYWAGWVLAYYQWYSRKPFKAILEYISMSEIIKMYHPLHEASEEKFADTLNIIIESRAISSKLQEMRKRYGYSQRQLAEKTGVNLRTLQQYEIGSKDLRKASVATVYSLANALGCKVEDIV